MWHIRCCYLLLPVTAGSCLWHVRLSSRCCWWLLPGHYDAAKEGYLKLEDIAGLLQLNVEEHRWDDAFLLLAGHSNLTQQVYLPYAKWLLLQDRWLPAGGASMTGVQFNSA